MHRRGALDSKLSSGLVLGALQMNSSFVLEFMFMVKDCNIMFSNM